MEHSGLPMVLKWKMFEAKRVIRARPDIWLPWCRLSPAAVGVHIHGRGDWAAATWDYMSVMPRAVASTAFGCTSRVLPSRTPPPPSVPVPFPTAVATKATSNPR